MKNLLLLVFAGLIFSCSDDEVTETKLPGKLAFTINNTFGSSAFALDTEYTTPGGDKITPNELRYWISNISLKNADGSTYEIPGSYYLLQNCKDQSVQDGGFTMPATKREAVSILGIPAGTYSEVTFSIGVDSEYNDNLTLQAGELSIMQNMTNVSWMWHTSYVFSKLGGTFKNAGNENVKFLFETGTNDLFRTITKSFSKPLTINGLKNAEVILKADASKLFTGIKVTDAKLSGTGASAIYRINPSTPELMKKLADNYTTAFELVSTDNVAE